MDRIQLTEGETALQTSNSNKHRRRKEESGAKRTDGECHKSAKEDKQVNKYYHNY